MGNIQLKIKPTGNACLKMKNPEHLLSAQETKDITAPNGGPNRLKHLYINCW